MRFIHFIITFLVFHCVSSWGQELHVKSFSLLPTDISARAEKRLDANGNICALIKVSVVPDCEFGGYIIGDVKKKLGEYWVYVCAITPRTRNLVVSSSGLLPLTIRFSDFGVEAIEGGSTYSLILVADPLSPNNVINGHVFVDLGLSVHWAECNIEAAFPEDCGKSYDWKDIVQSNRNVTIPKFISTTEFDIARKEWKSNWRLPKQTEAQELIDKCLFYSHSIGDIQGCVIIGPSGASIFIPFQKKVFPLTLCSEVLLGECANNNGEMKPLFLYIFGTYYGIRTSIYHMRGETMDCMIRPVIQNTNKTKTPYYKNSIIDGKVTIRGQLLCYQTWRRSRHIQAVHVKNAANNNLLYTLTFENTNHGIFEIQVPDGIKLRFEAEGYNPVEVELDDNIKIEFNNSYLEDPTPSPRFEIG